MFRLLGLTLEEFKFSLPERAVLVVVVDLVLQMDGELIILPPKAVDVRRGINLLLLTDLEQLLVLLPKLRNRSFVVSDQVLVFIFKVLQLEH